MNRTDQSVERSLRAFARPARQPVGPSVNGTVSQPVDQPFSRPVLPDDAGDVRYCLDDTAVGRMLLAVRRDGAVLASAFVPSDDDVDRLLSRLAGALTPRILRGGSLTDAARRELAEYLAGRRRSFDVRTDLTLATPFQRAVLGGLAATGYGARTTYGQLARTLGRPRAARAVGAALGANPLCVLLPCHRVVAADGGLTGYAGGLAAKRTLLTLESTNLGYA
jgi:methylated-DNA-[protein]-cysteine S-methyltransferase